MPKYFSHQYFESGYLPTNYFFSSELALSGNNLLFVYRQLDADSEELADYYLNFYGLDDTHKLAVPCSDNEILLDYTTFQSEVEDPIKNAISSLFFNVYVIVLGYNVPGGFYDGSDIISSTSRISRIFHTFDKRVSNYFYDRRVNPHLIEDDFSFAIICSRIDAPTLDIAKKMVGFGQEYRNQYLVNGVLFFDPISGLAGGSNSSTGFNTDYQEDLNDFYNNLLFKLNIEVSCTSSLDPYKEIVFPHLQHDSFYWGWFNDRSTESFFYTTDTARIFFYNADYDGAFTLRGTSAGNWCPLSISAGYLSTSGAMSNPGLDGFLRPRPFFFALNSSATIGEAYLFSDPYLDWTNCFVGDPLVLVNFPENSDESIGYPVTAIEDVATWNDLNVNLSRVIAKHWNKEIIASQTINLIVDSHDISTEVSLLYPTYDIYNDISTATRQARFSKLTDSLFEYAAKSIIPKINSQQSQSLQSINDFLLFENYKISKLLLGMSGYLDDISSNLILDEGFWQFEDYIYNETVIYTFYHFELDVATDIDFNTIILSLDSSVNQSGWEYEIEDNVFTQLPSEGVSTSFVGRKIKYSSSVANYLDRGIVYYFRIRQKNTTSIFEYSRFTDIIWS